MTGDILDMLQDRREVMNIDIKTHKIGDKYNKSVIRNEKR